MKSLEHEQFRIRIRINLSGWIRNQVYKLHLNFEEVFFIFIIFVKMSDIFTGSGTEKMLKSGSALNQSGYETLLYT